MRLGRKRETVPRAVQLDLLEAEGGSERAPAPVGIARLAALGEPVGAGCRIQFKSFPARSILNRTSLPGMPFRWTLNPYRGCEFACRYCYARDTHAYLGEDDPLDFERVVYVKRNAGWLLARDLHRVRPGEVVALGTATDPYQPAERRHRVTRSLLEELARHAGLSLGIVTKSTLVVRDIDLLHAIARRNKLVVHVTVTTLDAALARVLEPRAPRPDLRLEAVRRLNAAGVPAGVLCAPVLPGLTDSDGQLDALVRAAVEAGARHVHANALYLKPASASVFLPLLEERFPDLVARYRRLYAGGVFVDARYQRDLARRMRALRVRHGLEAADAPDRSAVSRRAGSVEETRWAVGPQQQKLTF